MKSICCQISLLLLMLVVASHATAATSLTVMPGIVDFQIVTIGESRTVSMTLSNSGIGNLVIDTLSFNGIHAEEFDKNTDTCSNQIIAPANTCTVNIVFSPASKGPKNAYFVISSMDRMHTFSGRH